MAQRPTATAPSATRSRDSSAAAKALADKPTSARAGPPKSEPAGQIPEAGGQARRSLGEGGWKLYRFAAQDLRASPCIWAHFRDGPLVPAFAHADTTPAEVGAALAAGQMQLWSIYRRGRGEDGAVVTQLNNTVRGRECLVSLLGGRGLRNWLHLLAEIEDWARGQGCVAMCVMGRKGWKRVLPDFRETGVILTKDI